MIRPTAELSAALALCLACAAEAPPPPAAASAARTLTLPVTDLDGLSSLAVGEGGNLFTLPERRPVLLELSPTGAEVRRSPLVGAPDGLEFESLAWLGGQRFAVGTEGGCEAGAERILLITRDADAARVDGVVELPLAAWGTACDHYRGVEGLCAASGRLVAALEAVVDAGERVAPLARVDLATGEPTALRLALTSTKEQGGKISSLDCRARDGALEVLAVERHFNLSRVIGFTLPLDGPAPATPLQPHVLVDLTPHASGGTRNFEGLARLDERHVLLIVDNYYGRVTGPNELLALELPP